MRYKPKIKPFKNLIQNGLFNSQVTHSCVLLPVIHSFSREHESAMTMELGPVVAVGSNETPISEAKKNEVTITTDPDSAQDESDAASEHSSSLRPPPLTWKLAAIVLVTCIGFGSQWAGGITGAMKTTIKKEMNIDNTQFALLEASEDFMVTALMVVSGIVTDRIGGAGK